MADLQLSVQLVDDRFNDFVWIFMFPESHHCPAALFKNRVDPSISIAVACKLRSPPLTIGFRGSSMDRASMPKAAV